VALSSSMKVISPTLIILIRHIKPINKIKPYFWFSEASPVFEAMLRLDMNEKATNTVTVDDISDYVVAKMLEFVYTGELENEEDWKDLELMSELLYSADKYGLDGLKLTCYRKLLDSKNEDTVPTIVILIHIYGAPPAVKEEVYNYCLA